MAVFGLSGMRSSNFGVGVNGTFSGTRFRATFNWVPFQDDMIACIDTLRQYGMTAAINLAKNRGAWTITDANGCKIYQPDLYEAEVRKWERSAVGDAVYFKMLEAFEDKTLIGYVGDELHASAIFCGSITKSQMNDMGLLYKEVFPGCITALRIPPQHLTPAPTGGWTGIDYCWEQFQYNGFSCKTNSPADCYANQLATAESVDLGLIPGFNWLNDMSQTLWDTDMNPSTPDARLDGLSSDSKFVIMPPEDIKRVVDAVAANKGLAPFLCGWSYIHPDFSPQEPYKTYMNRSDFVDAWTYGVNTLANTTGHSWRTPKGVTPPPPPPSADWELVGLGPTADLLNTFTMPIYFPTGVIQPGDLLVCFAYSRSGARTSSGPSGWVQAGRVSGGTTNGDLAVYFKIATTEGDGGTGEGHEYATVTWPGTADSTNTELGKIAVFRGNLGIQGSVLDAVGAVSLWDTSPNFGPIAGLTPPTAGDLLIVVGGRRNDFDVASPVPAGTIATLTGDGQTWSSLFVEQSAKGMDNALVAQIAVLSGTPTITSKTMVSSLPATGAGAGIMLAFKAGVAIPTLATIGPRTGEQYTELTFTATATGGGITYSLGSDASPGMAIDAASGEFTWTPQTVGTFTVTVKATNTSGTDSEVVTITVVESDHSAQVTGLPPSTTYDVRVAHVHPDTGEIGEYTTALNYATTADVQP